MPILNTDQIQQVLKAYGPVHASMNMRQRYYEGLHDITKQDNEHRTADGSPKNNVPDNFIQYIVESYTGALTSIPFNYVLKSDEKNVAPLEQLDEVIDQNDLHTLDTEHLRTALTMGYSVEVHSFTNGQIKITQHDPREWAFVFDEEGNMQAAIRQVELQPFTMYRGSILAKKQIIITIYDTDSITEYEQALINGKIILNEITSIKHSYGKVPVVLFSVNKSRQSFLSNALLRQNDLYNKVLNAGADDIEYNADALLVVSGDYSPTEIFNSMPEINKKRVLPLDKEGKAQFIQKGNDKERIEFILDRSREAIHRMSNVPDMKDIIGATGQASGTAIKLRYSKMMQTGDAIIKYIKQGVRHRIDLIQSVWAKLNLPTLGYYEIVVEFNLPTNNLDVWNALNNLRGITSHKTLLKLIPEIEDPESELETIRKEHQEQLALESPTSPVASVSLASRPNTPPTQVLKRTEQIVAAKADDTTSKLTQLLRESVKEIPAQEIASFAAKAKGS